MRLFSRRKNKDNNKNKNKNRSYQKPKHSHVRNIMSNIEKEGKKILDAATDNKLDVIKEMLNNNPSLINVAYSQGGYAILHIAAYKGYTDIIKYMFEFDKTYNKLNVNIKDKEGITPLLHNIVSKEGPHIDTMRELLKREDLDVNIKTKKFYTPLSTAIVMNSIESVKELLKRDDIDINKFEKYKIKNTDVNDVNNDDDDDDDESIQLANPLLFSILHLHLDIMDELLKYRNINIDIEIDGATPLNQASSNGMLEVVKKLVNVGANVNKQNKHGQTALVFASVFGKIDVVKYLLDNGAKTDLKDNDGYTVSKGITIFLNTVDELISEDELLETHKEVKDMNDMIKLRDTVKKILLLVNLHSNNLKINDTILDIINFEPKNSNNSIKRLKTLNIRELQNKEIYKEGNVISSTELNEFSGGEYVAIVPIINGDKKYIYVYYIENLSKFWKNKPLFNPAINKIMKQDEIDSIKIYKLVDSKNKNSL